MAKQSNEQKVLNALSSNGPMTQAELAKLTRVKGVYQLVAKMVKEGKVFKDGKLIVPSATDKLGSATPKPKTEHPALDFLKDERDRLMSEIEDRLNEYAYVLGRITKLTNEA